MPDKSGEFEWKTLVELLDYRASFSGNSIAYRFTGHSESGRYADVITYKELHDKSRAIAEKLSSHGLIPGDRVILIYAPGLDLISAFFGCLYAGMVAVLVYPPGNAGLVEKLQKIIINAEPRALLSTDDIIQKFRKLRWVRWLHKIPVAKLMISKFMTKAVDLSGWDMNKLIWITSDSSGPELCTRGLTREITGETLAFIQYTSGSTGTPKGVMVSHANLLHNLYLIKKSFSITSDDVIVSWLPAYHDMGLIGCILQPLYSGVTAYLMSPVDFLKNPFIWLETISSIRKSVISGGPNFSFDLCVQKIDSKLFPHLDLSRWSVAFNGAEPIRASTLKKFSETFKNCGFKDTAFYPCYGMAEATLIMSGHTRGMPPVVTQIQNGSKKTHAGNLSVRVFRQTG